MVILIILTTWGMKNLSHRKELWKPKSNQNKLIYKMIQIKCLALTDMKIMGGDEYRELHRVQQ